VQCLLAGRIWQRAHLLATTWGLAGRPCNEAVEWVDRQQALGQATQGASPLADLLGEPGWEPTFVFYLGYPSLPSHPARGGRWSGFCFDLEAANPQGH